MTTVIFIPVKTTAAKLIALHQTAQKYFQNKDPLLFLAADQTSYDFVDRLLWAAPPESFLPHPTPLLSISTALVSGFSAIFNLRPVSLEEPDIKTILEFEDHTSSEKLQLSKHRYQFYRERHFPIVISS